MRFARFLKKRTNTNPKRGPIHQRAPSKVLYRCIRGMVPHKMKRGECALSRLATYDGIPSPYDKKKRVVIPKALKSLRLAKGRKYTRLGQLCSEMGWRHADLIERLEGKRKTKSAAFYEAKKAKAKSVAASATAGAADLAPINAKLASLGY